MARARTSLSLNPASSPVWRTRRRRSVGLFAVGLLAGLAVGGSWLSAQVHLASAPVALYGAAFAVGLIVAWGRGPYVALVPAGVFLAVPAWLEGAGLAHLGTVDRAGVLIAALVGGLVAAGVNPARRNQRRSLAEARIARRRVAEAQGQIDTVAARVRDIELRLADLEAPAGEHAAERRRTAEDLMRTLTVYRVGLAAADDRLLGVERGVRRPADR